VHEVVAEVCEQIGLGVFQRQKGVLAVLDGVGGLGVVQKERVDLVPVDLVHGEGVGLEAPVDPAVQKGQKEFKVFGVEECFGVVAQGGHITHHSIKERFRKLLVFHFYINP
jgi:hypothetical protein